MNTKPIAALLGAALTATLAGGCASVSTDIAEKSLIEKSKYAADYRRNTGVLVVSAEQFQDMARRTPSGLR
jgi:hypothetical protein